MGAHMKKGLIVGLAMTAIVGLGGGAAAANGDGGGGRSNGPTCREFRTGGDGWSRRKLEVIGLTLDNRLICFREDRPGQARDLATVTGLTGDLNLVGVDFRPATGELIGLGNAGGVYSVNVADGVATKKSQLSVALDGTRFGVDFNPTVDRFRIVSDTGQNLRVNVDTGAATVDGALNYTAGTTAPGVVGAAYTNNDADLNTATTLFDLDANLDQVAIQAPPNAGTLNPTGSLGVDTGPVAEADIYSTVRNGTTVDVRGFAALTVGGTSGFYELSLFTGRATARGNFAGHNAVSGIAIPLGQR